VAIKHEIQNFVIATENVYRLVSSREPLTCHEAAILQCCLETLAGVDCNTLASKDNVVLRPSLDDRLADSLDDDGKFRHF